ncbi:MAG TPA: galactose-1-phosphate uridylyltransferase [Candidatus Kapabacteria bacterium]|nr:galactose-1-phosphate uridylyltransferase [Candidatus Kapabacteria bacterium]
MSELRYNPLLGEWLATATHRQDRTFLPPPGFCPLCPTAPGGFPSEVPEPEYDIVVFENRFPSLQSTPPEPAIEGTELYPVEPAAGVCEVVLYSSEHDSTLALQPVSQIEKLIRVWADRYTELSKHDFVKYVFIFENRGTQIGVTLTHPHGQIYAYPFIPPVLQRELANSKKHHDEKGTCLICDIRSAESDDGRRLVTANDTWTAYIPFFARWPYEVHITPNRHLQSLPELDDNEVSGLAEVMKKVLSAYDKLFDMPMPYLMVMHGKPSDGQDHDHYHFHIELYPFLRTANKLKYLAGSETGAGMFINDTLPEDKAEELRKIINELNF